MITALQCKQARACLDWSIRQLAEKVKVNPNTIIRFEAGGDPKSSVRDRIEAAIVGQGIVLQPNGKSITPPDELVPVAKPQSYAKAA